MKNIVFVGFTGMQIELARKFVTYRNLHNEVQLVPEEPLPTRVDAFVVNSDHHEAAQRLAKYLQIRPALVLGTGSQQVAGIHAFVPGSFKPATADRLVELLKAKPALDATLSGATSEAATVVLPGTRLPTNIANKVVSFPAANAAQPATVLVVDDSDVVRKTMVRKIGEYGQRVDIAVDGNEALEMLMHTKYALVFLDIMMPGMDGFEVCKRIKKSAEHKSTAVYMLSSKDGMFDKVRGSMAGCNGYLVKPLETRQLRTVIEKQFGKSSEDLDSQLPGDSGFFQDSRLPGSSQSAKNKPETSTTKPVEPPKRPTPMPARTPLPMVTPVGKAPAPLNLGDLPMDTPKSDEFLSTVRANI
jgi:CheY-like chemotaxis protein